MDLFEAIKSLNENSIREDNFDFDNFDDIDAFFGLNVEKGSGEWYDIVDNALKEDQADLQSEIKYFLENDLEDLYDFPMNFQKSQLEWSVGKITYHDVDDRYLCEVTVVDTFSGKKLSIQLPLLIEFDVSLDGATIKRVELDTRKKDAEELLSFINSLIYVPKNGIKLKDGSAVLDAQWMDDEKYDKIKSDAIVKLINSAKGDLGYTDEDIKFLLYDNWLLENFVYDASQFGNLVASKDGKIQFVWTSKEDALEYIKAQFEDCLNSYRRAEEMSKEIPKDVDFCIAFTDWTAPKEQGGERGVTKEYLHCYGVLPTDAAFYISEPSSYYNNEWLEISVTDNKTKKTVSSGIFNKKDTDAKKKFDNLINRLYK